MIASLKSIKLGGKTGVNSFWNLKNVTSYTAFLQKKLKLVAHAFDDRNKSLP